MTSLNEFRLNDYIQHMLQAIQRIEEYTEEHAEDYFLKTPLQALSMFVFAVIFHVIGCVSLLASLL